MILIYSFYIFLFKCILLTVPCLSEATVGGEPGCEVPFIAACSFNYYYYYYFPNLIAFWGPKHARKVTKLCTRPRSGENLHLIWVSKVGVAKWLDSATYTLSTVCASSYVSRNVWKSVHSCNTPIPTKKSLEAKSQTNRKWLFLINSSNFCVIFEVFRSHTLTNSS